MKDILKALCFLLIFSSGAVKAQVSPMTIDQFDTVYFDLSSAVVNGNQVEFPVFYDSDDQIVALDFNFKYNHNKLDYDTIIKLANYLDVLAFYNVNDSTVRLTSYTNTLFYPNDSNLFKVRFNILQPGTLCSGDIFAVNSLLNGDICTSGIIDCTSGLEEQNLFSGVRIYPNPVIDQTEISGIPAESTVELRDINGKVVARKDVTGSQGSLKFDLSNESNGIYHLLVMHAGYRGAFKVVKSGK